MVEGEIVLVDKVVVDDVADRDAATEAVAVT